MRSFRAWSRPWLLAALLISVLTSCNRVELAYRNLDLLVPWTLDRYLDLDGPQRRLLAERLERHLDWHCSTQLPYELAHALLERSAPQDERGEIEFYQALLLIRQGPEPSEVVRLLEKAADKGHPHAVALLYKIHQEPYLIEARDLDKADAYREAYTRLDVAQSGYPSFEKALALVSQLVEAPPPSAAYEPRCPEYCRSQ